MMKSNAGQILKLIAVAAAWTMLAIGPAKSNEELLRTLKNVHEENGYRFESARMTAAGPEAIACRNGKRLRMKFMNRNGRISSEQEIGSCARERTRDRRRVEREDDIPLESQIKRALSRQGYTQIEVDLDNGQTRITACADGRIHRLSPRQDGSMRSIRTQKRCRPTEQPRKPVFEANDIKPMLRREGFKRIAIVRSDSLPYIARACRGSDRLELKIGRRGQIRQERRIDKCQVRIDPDNLEELVRKRGFDSVNVVRRSRRPYLVDGCRNGDFTRLYLDRYGKVERRKRLGRCAPRLSRGDIRRSLSRQNLKILAIERRDNGWLADVCNENRRIALLIGFRGSVVDETAAGNCRSEKVLDILETLEDRGASNVSTFVEGCFKGTKYRWSYDRLGKRTGRTRIGTCG